MQQNAGYLRLKGNFKKMKTKVILALISLSLLSSCCWFVKVDCAENDGTFSIPVVLPNDTLIGVNEPLSLFIEGSAFQGYYESNGYDNSSISITITWFDGNFTSDASHKVEVLSSNPPGFNLEDYSSFYLESPTDMQIDLGFTVPGYYLIQFYGGASKEDEGRRKKCSCGNYLYQSFQFESNIMNSQYLDLYSSSLSYTPLISELELNGSYFIQVE